MTEHYFTPRPQVASHELEFSAELRGWPFRFVTDRGVFSRGHVDRATALLAGALELPAAARVLDLGCGYGALGIVAARLAPAGHVILVDINERAAALAQRNLALNGITNAEVRVGDGVAPVRDLTFTDVVSNPPFRAGKAAVYALVEGARTVLEPGGRLWLVAGNKQGAPSLKRFLAGLFGSVTDVARGGGIHVLRAVKP